MLPAPGPLAPQSQRGGAVGPASQLGGAVGPASQLGGVVAPAGSWEWTHEQIELGLDSESGCQMWKFQK